MRELSKNLSSSKHSAESINSSTNIAHMVEVEVVEGNSEKCQIIMTIL